MINISQEAQKHLSKIIKKKDKMHILRISIKFPGKKYAECKIFYDDIKNIQNTDIKMEYTDFTIYVHNMIMPYLKNAHIDLFQNDLSKQLMLMAPYATQEYKNNTNVQNSDFLSHHESFFNEVNNYIINNINPILSRHGGKIILINITKSGYVMIKFIGGCNGCVMSSTTVKEGIEKKLLNCFHDLKGVKDITDHERGQHSFM